MFVQAMKAAVAAVRLLFGNKRALLLLVLLYAALLGAGYVFLSTREATVTQLFLTLASVVVGTGLVVALVAVRVNYVSETGVK
jgi:hypothetical protein